MEYVSTILLKKDDNDANFVHLYIPGVASNYYLCSLHIDSLYDLFGEYNCKEIKNLIANGEFVPFALGLQLQS